VSSPPAWREDSESLREASCHVRYVSEGTTISLSSPKSFINRRMEKRRRSLTPSNGWPPWSQCRISARAAGAPVSRRKVSPESQDYYGSYKKQNYDDLTPSILELDGSYAENRKNWPAHSGSQLHPRRCSPRPQLPPGGALTGFIVTVSTNIADTFAKSTRALKLMLRTQSTTFTNIATS